MEAPTTFETPLSTSRDVPMDDVSTDVLEIETDKENTDVPKETNYGNLLDLETIEQSVVQTSVTETSIEGPSGVS